MAEIAIQEVVQQSLIDTQSKQVAMLHDYLFNSMKQSEIAIKYGITQQGVSNNVRRILNDESIKNKLVSSWEKEYSIKARKLALELIDNIDPATHPKSKLAWDSAILVDKARLIDSETTQNIGLHVVSERIEGRRKRLEELYREQGLDADDSQ